MQWRAHRAAVAISPAAVASPAQVRAILAQVARIRPELVAFFGEEGMFTICSSWLVSALAMIGEAGPRTSALPEAAVVRRAASALRGGEHLGNFPQAFTHLALIEAVSLLVASELEQDVKSAGWDPAASTQVRSG